MPRLAAFEYENLDILFVQNYYEQMLGIMQISAILKQHGFTTDVILGTKRDIIKGILDKKPRVVGFYCTTGFHHKNIAVAKEVKRLMGDEILTIIGGPHPTFVPETIESEGVDIICRGEGEYAVLELMIALRDNKDYTKIKNLTVKKDGHIHQNELRPLCDLDRLPHLDREIYRDITHIYKNKRHEFMLSRGCPFNCTFCSAQAYRELYRGKGDYTRFRSIASVIEELDNTKKRYNPTCFFFHDDTFIINKDYCREFLRDFKSKINLPFACLIRADLATDEMIKFLKEAGCYLASFGIESGNANMRNGVLRKNLSEEQILNCAIHLHKYRISFATFNMIGLPDESLNQIWDTVDLNAKIRPRWAWFSVYQTLPQTQLVRHILKNGCVGRVVDVAESDSSFHESSLVLRSCFDGKKKLRLKNLANIVIKFPNLKIFVKYIFLVMPLDTIYGLVEKGLYYLFYFSKLTYKLKLIESIRGAFFIVRHIREFK